MALFGQARSAAPWELALMRLPDPPSVTLLWRVTLGRGPSSETFSFNANLRFLFSNSCILWGSQSALIFSCLESSR